MIVILLLTRHWDLTPGRIYPLLSSLLMDREVRTQQRD